MVVQFFLRNGRLQRRSELSRFATVSVSVQIMGREFFHTMGRVRSIATISSPLPSEGETNTSLGAFVGIIPMC